jgi:hypothetical protein
MGMPHGVMPWARAQWPVGSSLELSPQAAARGMN